LELALVPQQQQQSAAGVWPAASAGGPAGGVKLYPLSDALLPGGVAAAAFLPQQHQHQLVHAQQQQQQQQLTLGRQDAVRVQQQHQQQVHGIASPAGSDNERSSIARPPSSSMEFSFVQQPADTGDGRASVEAAAAAAAGASSTNDAEVRGSNRQQQLQTELPPQHQQQLQHEEVVGSLQGTSGVVLAEVQEIAAAAPGVAQAAAALSNAISPHWQQQQCSRESSDAALSDVPAILAPLAAGNIIAGQASPPAATDNVTAAQRDNNVPECDMPDSYAVDSMQPHQQGQEAEVSTGADNEANATAMHGEQSGAVVGALSQVNSAVALDAAAAAAHLEGVRLSSSSSMGASGSRSVDRYASWAAAGGYAEKEEGTDDAVKEDDELQQYAVGVGTAADAQDYMQQQAMQESAAWQEEDDAEGWQGPAEQRQPGTPSSPGWLGELQHVSGGQHDIDDAGSETGEGGAAAAARSGGEWMQEPLSPGSSNGSVF
jgi:hypothetical protein